MPKAGVNPALAQIGIADLVDHYAKQIDSLDQVPILIGHSFGGLIVQLLLDRGLGSGGVALDPAPVCGVHAGFTAFLVNMPVLRSWLGWRKIHDLSLRSFSLGFANSLTEKQQEAAYREHVVPTPGRIFFQAALGRQNKVDFKNSARAPLLLAVGSDDRTAQPAMVRKNFRLARSNTALTEFHEFPDRCHFLIGQPGWEQVADYAILWCRRMMTFDAMFDECTIRSLLQTNSPECKTTSSWPVPVEVVDPRVGQTFPGR